MLDQGARYAVYFVPDIASDLHRFGSSILGYNCFTGEDVQLPDDIAVDAEAWRRLTEAPRRYGFHATFKAPFRLGPDRTEAELVDAFLGFARLPHDVARIEPQVRLLGGFTAIVPREPVPVLVDLATRCTQVFDAFRAPMTASERERRISSGLSQTQIENLDRWGYPHLFADFRFHMTLTGRVPVDDRDRVLALLQHSFARICGDRSITVDRLALLKQDDARAPFRVLCQAQLRPR
jgi:Protein of unknown function (DUF1045)